MLHRSPRAHRSRHGGLHGSGRHSSGWHATRRGGHESVGHTLLDLSWGGRRGHAGLRVGNHGITAYYNRHRHHGHHDRLGHRSYLGLSYGWEFHGGHYYPYGYQSHYDLYYHRYPYHYVRTYDYYPTWTVYVDTRGDLVGPPAPGGGVPLVNGQLQVEPQQRIPVRNEHLAEGERAFRAGNHAEARQSLIRSVLDDPGNGFAQLAYGLCHFALGDYAAAAGAVRRGLSLVPDVVDLPLDITRVYASAADLEGHVRSLRKHVESFPDDQDAWFLLGYVLYSSGDAPGAVVALTRAASIDPLDTFAAVLRDAASRVQ